MAPTTPIIQTTQVGPGLGTAGEGRDDLLLAVAVDCSDTEAANAGESYEWFLDDVPPGSTAVLTGAATATPSITGINVPGSHLLRCRVDGTFESEEILAVKFPNIGERFPVFGEEPGDFDAGGETQGYHKPLYGTVVKTEAALVDIAALQSIPLIDGEHKLAQSFTIGTVLSVPHSLGRNYKGFICTNGLRITELATQTDKTTQIDLLVEPWELVERKTSDTPATSLTWSGLDGDADQSWEWIIHRCRNSSGGTRNYRLKPNSVIGAAQDSQQMLAAGTTATSGGYGSSMQFARQGDAVRWSGKVTLNGMSGYYRTMQSFIGNLTSTPDTSHTTYSAGWTDESATNITSVVWDLDAGINGFDDYDISLFRFTPKKTAADIWIF